MAERVPLTIVGPGRLGRSVALVLRRQGVHALLVGRGEDIPASRVTLLTVPDRAVADVARRVPPEGVLLHTSGALEHDCLRPHPTVGSLHPLMSFPGPDISIPEVDGGIPAAVAGDPEAVDAATELAHQLDWVPFVVPGDRRAYHAAAVMAGNHATVLLGMAAELLSHAGVPGEHGARLLAPLAVSSLQAAAMRGPAETLTGPVARGDEEVLLSHQLVLADLDPTIRSAYDALTTATRRLVAKGKAKASLDDGEA